MDRTKPLSPAWYLLALFLVFAGLTVGPAVGGTAWNFVRHAQISSANGPLQAKGESVFVFTDVLQTDRQIRCVSKEPGQTRVLGPRPTPLTVEDDGATWNLIAWERYGRDDMDLSCAPKDGRVDNAQYAFAQVPEFDARSELGLYIMSAFLLAGAISGGVVFFKRRRALNRGQN